VRFVSTNAPVAAAYEFKVGDQVLFSGRVCSVAELGRPEGKLRVDMCDAGGVNWSFDTRPDQLKILGYPKEMILDHMSIAGKKLPEHQEETERRMAQLRVGDMFHEMFSFWILIEELPADGRVLTVHSGRYLPDQRTYEWIPQDYPTAAAFRTAQAYGSIPGYTCIYGGNHILDRK